MKNKARKRNKIIAILLYVLPVLFFVNSYFLMTTSGEDMAQGANQAPNVIESAVSWFKWSGRASDAYQYAIIKYYSYTSFEGSFSNFVFRLLNIALVVVFAYVILLYIFRRRPQLHIKDAIIANMLFVILIYSAHAKVLYRGFSLINNYLFIGIATVLFCLPFINDVYKKREHSWPFSIWMLVAGFMFGISHNLTPVAFLLAYFLYYLYLRFIEKQKNEISQNLRGWKIAALVGLMIGVAFCYIVGPGVSGYTNSNYTLMYDYVSISDIMASPAKSFAKIVGHMVSNFNNIVGPLYLPIILCGVIVMLAEKHWRVKFKKWTIAEKRTIIALVSFMFAYWLSVSQIKQLTRLYFPAHITGIILVLYIFYHYFREFDYKKINKKLAMAFMAVLICASTFAVIYRTCIAFSYYRAIAPQLQTIKNSTDSEVCVDRKKNLEKAYPIDNFVQEPIFEDWTMPEKVYDKTVSFCRE